MNNEPKTAITWCGRPVEELTREERIQALTVAEKQLESPRGMQCEKAPYIIYVAMLRGAEA